MPPRRDYYVRLAGNDYSAHPSAIGRNLEVAASMNQVVISCAGQVIGTHRRCWDTARTITDPEHVAAAKELRRQCAIDQRARHEAARRGKLAPTEAAIVRDTSSYDELFGTDFDPAGTPTHAGAVA